MAQLPPHNTMADRAILETDALGNQTMTTFDNNGNPVIVQLTELGTITQPAQAPESFGTVNKFDCMDQLVFSAQNGPDNSISSQPGVNLARITFNGFDSRGNGVISLDANGNGVINSFDGASRPLSERRLMRQNGQGSNPPLSADNNTASQIQNVGVHGTVVQDFRVFPVQRVKAKLRSTAAVVDQCGSIAIGVRFKAGQNAAGKLH